MSEPRVRELARRVLRLEAEGILALVPKIDAAFDAAVDVLHRCAGRVIVTGMGKSGLIGRKIAATLASTGTPSYFLHPAEGMHGDLGMLARGDVLLALSNSGETDELLAILPSVKRLGVPTVLLTGRPDAPLARMCEVVIDVAVPQEACPMNLAPTSSTTAALAMGDAIAMALLDLRGLRPEDYAALHPRGALGWRSLVRVQDLMRSGPALPAVDEGAALKDVVEEMTRKGLGMTTVVDPAGRLVGLVTDGDLRRMLVRGAPSAAPRAGDIASRSPKTIAAGELAAKALDIMEAFAITSLVVTEASGRPVGVLHMHHILQAKIV